MTRVQAALVTATAVGAVLVYGPEVIPSALACVAVAAVLLLAKLHRKS